MSEYSKLVQNVYKTRYDWVEKVTVQNNLNLILRISGVRTAWNPVMTNFSGILRYKRIT